MMKKISAAFLALMLVPTLALAALMEGTVVKMDKGKNQIVVKTEQGEKTLKIAGNTKGLENAKEGAKVKIQYSEKGDQLVASEIFSGKADQNTAPEGKKSSPLNPFK